MAGAHGFRCCLTIICYVLLLSSGKLNPVSGFSWKNFLKHFFYLEKVTVIITNNFLSHQDLILHCKSWHDDLGRHRLYYKESFTFRFVPDIFQKTRFYCEVELEVRHGELFSQTYDLYYALRDVPRCGTKCEWLLNEFGLNSYIPAEKRWKTMYHWYSTEEVISG
ncbi:hypothetical protein SLEP1_g44352 [Rubroshorea leprosula]|uniref:S-protein homolog n=1 Tax=Rubroshorea leprosula TaxID=152421 RepID=A0AAV5LGE4_9ROSI|nr:hypothetical protein SLEP1_g44352 [Rubroshorea leprosula]